MNYLDRAVTEAGGIVLRYGLFYGAANDGLICAGAKAAVPDRRGRRRLRFVHPPGRRGCRDRARAGEGRTGDLQHRRRRARPRARVGACGRRGARREAAAALPGLARADVAGEVAVMLGTEARGASNARPSGSSAGRCATRAGDRASSSSIRRWRLRPPSRGRPHLRRPGSRGPRLEGRAIAW